MATTVSTPPALFRLSIFHRPVFFLTKRQIQSFFLIQTIPPSFPHANSWRNLSKLVDTLLFPGYSKTGDAQGGEGGKNRRDGGKKRRRERYMHTSGHAYTHTHAHTHTAETAKFFARAERQGDSTSQIQWNTS